MGKCTEETVVQFGESGFLRSFVNYFFHKLQEKGLYDGKVVVAQPIEKGMYQMLLEQNCEYDLFLRGVDNEQVVNEHTHVASMFKVLNLYAQCEEYVLLAENPDLRVSVSNTAEAGIEYLGIEKLTDMPPKPYPAKLTQFLHKRLKAGLKGLTLLLREPVDDSGDNLKKYVLQYTELRELRDGFRTWSENENDFCSTLIDRIVTGYLRDEVEELMKQTGYKDKLIDAAEILHPRAIDGYHEDELPFQKAGYSIVWIDDVHPRKKRKARILNEGRISMVLGAYLYGLGTVGECMKDEKVSASFKKCILEEIIPTVGDIGDNHELSAAILERFFNLSIRYQLLSIALNPVSKLQARAPPIVLEYKEEFGHYPGTLTFSMVALIVFYCMNKANDGDEIMQLMKKASVEGVMKHQDYWYTDLSKMILTIEEYYELTQCKGIAGAYETALRQWIRTIIVMV